MKIEKKTWVLAALFAGVMAFFPLVACGPAKAKCTSSTCFGCCNAKDECENGASATSCGGNGAMCAVCPFGSLCQLGVCNNGQGTGGSGGGTTGGGTGGGTTGGGTGGGTTGGGTGGGTTGGGTGGGTTGGGTGGGTTGGGTGGGGAFPGESCAMPQTLQFVNNVATVTGTTVGYQNDVSASCANAGQPDRVFLLTVPTGFQVGYSLTYSGFQPAFSVHSYSGGVCTSELNCRVAAGPGQPITSPPAAAPAGTYALVIDSQTTGGGSFTLTVTRATAMTTDAGQAQPLINGVSQQISGATDQEQYFVINVPTGTPSLTITTTGGTGDVDLYLSFGTQPMGGTGTYNSALEGNAETITVPSPTPGNWYLTTVGYATYSGASLVANY